MHDGGYREGIKAATPIALGYLPVAMAFGVLARKAGLQPFEVVLMSLLVYAGASQFIAVEMMSKGFFLFPIVLATFFVNLRHFLMSSTLSLYFKRSRIRTLGLLSSQLTDETFAVAMANRSKMENRPEFLFGLQVTVHLAWILGSVAGALFGPLIESSQYGLPFALPALFICLLLLQLKSRNHLWAMGLAGLFSILFKKIVPGNWHIILSALLASGAALLMEVIRKKK